MMKANIVFLSLILLISGCSWFGERQEAEKSAEELVTEAASNYRDGNFKTATEQFTTLKDWYPFSKYAILAELKIADSHYELESYDEAMAAYQEFENLHPKNEAIPYVIYKMGQSWYKRVGTVDKDQAPAKKAIAEFTRLIAKFPNDPLSIKAEKKIRRCISRIAGHELFVAKFYLKSKRYKAALKRFEYLFATYPDTRQGRAALNYITLCKSKIESNDNGEAGQENDEVDEKDDKGFWDFLPFVGDS